MARKKKHHEEHIDETWLIPYADMLTLLLALFIVLFAVSSVDAEKYQQLMVTFNENFQGGSGVLDHPMPSPELNMTPPAPEQTSESDYKTKEHNDLKKIQEEINEYIKGNGLESELETKLTADGLLITIVDNVLFYSGSADVRTDAVRLAQTISNMLTTEPPRKIVVAGHTDNIQISNSNFRSNWDLSAQRALNFMKILLENEDLDPRNLSATGHGEYQPIASNETEEGRGRNRRVEVLILPNYFND
ncbi:flagellar motor protein MotB [Halalkalibacter akibai]|uniref:Flagellar motor rotation protein MotB n=1 Tax=Halalkalibacter akibai (strain ATCC 43226 / DSM 21942 / CIP 109018 / JCM 9157 / 1139) TaxID=1236973 RepID=W4QSV9_HALA3|nr:flagellar motor protein MotB [Halalkalibacter akibai]GAE34972.1 flagellar motor rotation protein MotB [Halalkalibacter akibai JCM 9157]